MIYVYLCLVRMPFFTLRSETSPVIRSVSSAAQPIPAADHDCQKISGDEEMKETLRQIFEHYGMDVFRNGSRLLSFYADLAPRDMRGKHLLSCFLQCDGNEKLISVLEKPAPEQASAIRLVIRQMTSGLSIAEDASQEVCCAFWLAIGGKPVELSVPTEQKPTTPPAPHREPVPPPVHPRS